MTRSLGSAHPHAFRQYGITPSQADDVVAAAAAAAHQRSAATDGPLAWALHLSYDRTRVVTVESWRDIARFRRGERTPDPVTALIDPHPATGTGLYQLAGVGGIKPTPIGDPSLGVTVIDVFDVWRPLVRPVSLFNLRNGAAFNKHPGCRSTTVLRGRTVGRIATYARWRTIEDFVDAFASIQGTPVTSTDDINAATARISRGLIHTDYHAYDVVSTGGPGIDGQVGEGARDDERRR